MTAMKRCVIVGGADIGRYDRIRAYLWADDFYICCDSGLNHREGLGIAPDLIVGDFDSYENPHLAAETMVLPCEKDDTDTVFAVKEALKRGFQDFLLISESFEDSLEREKAAALGGYRMAWGTLQIVNGMDACLGQHNESNEDIDYTPERRLVLRCPVMAQVKHLLRYRRIIIVSNQGGIEAFPMLQKCLCPAHSDSRLHNIHFRALIACFVKRNCANQVGKDIFLFQVEKFQDPVPVLAKGGD